jgi:hypothetical protein
MVPISGIEKNVMIPLIAEANLPQDERNWKAF